MNPTMPAEWEKHERTWMAWPSNGYTLGDTEADVLEARSTWANVANAIVRFEPVTMVVTPTDVAIARAYLDAAVDIVEHELDDAWMRDMGPTFVRSDDGIAAVNWIFNGWGAQDWASWEHDSQVATAIADITGATRIDSPLTNEGGGIHTNGDGVLLVTETVQLDPGRNPGWSREQVEAEFARTIGARRVIWFDRGLTRDYDEFGTRGHIDIVACFSDAQTILFHDQLNPEHPDFEISARTRQTIEAAGFTAVSVPAPDTLRDDEGWVDYSYINHYIVNGAVILCAFDDEGDARAKAVLETAYPGREIVLVDARPLFARGGGIHCITQQQPAL
ncbi:MAG: Agmatine deiminase [Actinomycetota bacterium]|jgi:agmatine deiminase